MGATKEQKDRGKSITVVVNPDTVENSFYSIFRIDIEAIRPSREEYGTQPITTSFRKLRLMPQVYLSIFLKYHLREVPTNK